MVVDTSAILAILLEEPEAEKFSEAIVDAESVTIAAPNLLEAAIVLLRADRKLGDKLDQLVMVSAITTVPFGAEHVAAAKNAYQQFGKGSGHGAGLNFGDCIAYAVASVNDEPLLYKGNDFSQTDIQSAL